MSEYKAANKTIQDACTPTTLLEPEVIGGKERVIYDSYTFAGEAAGSILVLPELPKGAMIVDWVIDHAAMGTGVSFKFGTRNDDDCFMAAATVIAAAKKTYAGNGIASSLGYRCDDETSGSEKTKPIITTSGQAATGAVKVMIKYVVKA